MHGEKIWQSFPHPRLRGIFSRAFAAMG
jgi:hypothetical protein